MNDARSPRGSWLRRLDDRVLPAVRHGMHSLGQRAGRPFDVFRRLDDGVAGGRLAASIHRNRQFVALLAALIAFTGSFVHMQRLSDPSTTVADGQRGDRGVTGEAAESDAVAVGPSRGTDVETYVAERAAALASAPEGTRLAVVSFDAYRTAEEAEALVLDTVETHHVQLRIPLEDSEPLTVSVGEDIVTSVDAALGAEREAIAAEEEEFRQLLESGTVTDSEFESFYEAEVDRLTAVRNLLDSGTGTVFAVVVEAPVERLRELTATDGVRLVDLAPEGTTPQDTAFYGLLPDGGETVAFGSSR